MLRTGTTQRCNTRVPSGLIGGRDGHSSRRSILSGGFASERAAGVVPLPLPPPFSAAKCSSHPLVELGGPGRLVSTWVRARLQSITARVGDGARPPLEFQGEASVSSS